MCSKKIWRCILIKNHRNNLLYSYNKLGCRSFELNLFSHCFNLKDLNLKKRFERSRKDLLFALQVIDLTKCPKRILSTLRDQTADQWLPVLAHRWIGQFQVDFCLCGKKSLCAKLNVPVCRLLIHSHENQVIFMWNVLHEHSIWKRGKQQLGIGSVKSAYGPSSTPAFIPVSVAWSD